MHQSDFFSTDARIDLPMIERGRRTRVVDGSGRRLLDAGSGPVLTNLGLGSRRVARAANQQYKTLSYVYVRTARHRPNEALATRIAAMNLSGFDASYLSTDGSDAVEAALKLARALVVARGERARTRIITLAPAYHGATFATLALSDDPVYADYLAVGGVRCSSVPSPFALARRDGIPDGPGADEASLRLLRENLADEGSENVLAIVVEPVGGVASGAYVLSEEYLRGLRNLCDEHGIQLVFDEVMAGIRSGWFVTSDRYAAEARPDFVAIGKGLGAGYAPISATLLDSGRMTEIAEGPGFNLSHTYNANPVSCSVAGAVLDEVRRRDLLGGARRKERIIRRALGEMAADGLGVTRVQGSGLLLAAHLAEPRDADRAPSVSERLRRAALRRGLILYTRDAHRGAYGHWVMLAPALNSSERTLSAMLQRLRAALTDVYGGGSDRIEMKGA